MPLEILSRHLTPMMINYKGCWERYLWPESTPLILVTFKTVFKRKLLYKQSYNNWKKFELCVDNYCVGVCDITVNTNAVVSFVPCLQPLECAIPKPPKNLRQALHLLSNS